MLKKIYKVLLLILVTTSLLITSCSKEVVENKLIVGNRNSTNPQLPTSLEQSFNQNNNSRFLTEAYKDSFLISWNPDWKHVEEQVNGDTLNIFLVPLNGTFTNKITKEHRAITTINMERFLVIRLSQDTTKYSIGTYLPANEGMGLSNNKSKKIQKSFLNHSIPMKSFTGLYTETDLVSMRRHIYKYAHGFPVRSKSLLANGKIKTNDYIENCNYTVTCSFVNNERMLCGYNINMTVTVRYMGNQPPLNDGSFYDCEKPFDLDVDLTGHLCDVHWGFISSYVDAQCTYTWEPDPPSLPGDNPGNGGGGDDGNILPTDNAQFTQRINDDELADCFKGVLASFATNETNLIANKIYAFAGETPGFNWTLKEGGFSGGSNATTSPVYDRVNGVVTTAINSANFSSATDLAAAKTLLHESLHAYLTAWLWSSNANFQLSFPELIDEFNAQRHPDLNELQHNEIVRSWVGEIASALEKYGLYQGYNASSQYYTDLAWGGLQDTAAFKALPVATRNRILDVLNTEQYGHDRNNNPTVAKGSPLGCH